ncbi:MAG: hypothetical protein ACR2PG_26770 [Hyphomicrobiaceae bacterium]
MALCGEGAVCIWNDITPEGEADYYAWHNTEHMPERVGIPGFLRGRRYVAADAATKPRFFTLYEVISPEVITGQDYLNRLNAPTPWTKRASQTFRNTFRALTRVKASFGPASGGALATLRAAVSDSEHATLERLLVDNVLPSLVRLPMMTGVHLCMTNMEASAGRTAETRGRTDIMEPPNTIILFEGCNVDAVRACVAQFAGSDAAVAGQEFEIGLYALEYLRLKTGVSPG